MKFFFVKLHGQIDWSKPPRFRDKELAGIDFSDTPDGRVADKLVEVSLREGGTHWVLVHIEVQAQRDSFLARRILDYNYRIFKQHDRPVASLVLLADDDPGWRPHAFHNQLLGTVMGMSFTTAKLLDFAARTDNLLASHNPFAWVTLAHLRTRQARHDPDLLYAAKWQLTRLLYQHGWNKKRIIDLFNVINWMMALPEPYQQRYWQALLALEKEQKMEWISPLEQSFLDRGRQQDAVAMLERQLTRRFGPLPQTVQKKLAKASMEQLEIWGDALLDARSLKQVVGQKTDSTANLR